MKILVVANSAEFIGGANKSLMMVVERLKRDYNAEIEVLLPRKEGVFNDKLNEAGIKWHYFFPYFGLVSSIRKDGKDLLRIGKPYIGYIIECFAAFFASKKFKKSNFDLVYTNTRMTIVGAKIAKKLKLPHVCHVREFGPENPLWGLFDYKDVYRLSDKIICISNALTQKFSEYVPTDKLVTIHNGIESPLDLECNFDKKKETFDMILAGRIVYDKCQDEAIEALNILYKKGYKDIKLHIVGSSQKGTYIKWYEDKINNMVKEYGLENNVIFHGEVQDMVEIRKNMDIELMCAIRETFGRVTVEGMRSGLAVIGTNTGGTVEIINDGENGLLYEQGSAEDLASKIEKLYKDRNYLQKIAQKGFEFARVNFTPEENVKKIYAVFDEVIKNKED